MTGKAQRIRNQDGTFAPRKISLEPTRELGYFCGLVIGDGSIHFNRISRNYEIRMQSTKKNIVNIFRRSAKRLGLNPSRIYTYVKTRKFPNGEIRTDKMHNSVANSKILYVALRPCKKTDYKWDIPDFLTTKESLFGFVGGLFDAEGNVSRWSISISSKHNDNLIKLKKLLKERLGFTKGIVTITKGELHIYGRENLKLFKKAEVRIKKKRFQELLEKPVRGYTEKDYERVMQLHKDGLGSVRISKIVKIPVSTIEDWIYKGQKPWKQYDKVPYYKREKKPQKSIKPFVSKVLKLREKGLSSREIGKILGFDKTTILGVLKKFNKGKTVIISKKYSKEKYEKVMELRRRHKWGSIKISKRMRISRSTIDAWIYRESKPYKEYQF